MWCNLDLNKAVIQMVKKILQITSETVHMMILS